MKNIAELRKRLESTAFPDLGAMMDGYAHAAAEIGRREFGQKLDFTSESIDGLDDILVRVGESPEQVHVSCRRVQGSNCIPGSGRCGQQWYA